jgi:hypothetical protein
MRRFRNPTIAVLIAALVVPTLTSCGSGATGARDELKPFDKVQAAKKEKKESHPENAQPN